MCEVVNKHYQAYDVYIGRGSPLGNPFPIDESAGQTRAIVIEQYRRWLWKEIKEGRVTLDYLRSLDGKRLGCFCAPKACHGDVIVQAVKWAKEQTMQEEAIKSFNGNYRFLSNFWYSAVPYDGQWYRTVEHAYQAAKTIHEEHREYIRGCTTPGEAKSLGRQIPMRSDWNEIKVDVMRTLLREKFKDEGLRDQLLATGDAELIEGNTWGDYFWGVCYGEGQNWLGKLLMEVREAVK